MPMDSQFLDTRRRGLVACFALSPIALLAKFAYGQDKSGFPDGYDAVEAAPNSHKVIFENALVRVLEVTIPPPGKPNRCIIIAGQAFS